MSTSASASRSKSSNGLTRSLNTVPSAPGFICSKPSASTQSAAPLSIAWRARNRAGEPPPARRGREEKAGGAGRAVVVDVEGRDAGHAQAIDDLLAAGRVAVDI